MVPPMPDLTLPRIAVGLWLACVLAGCAASPPRPAEDPQPDVVAEFLIERGLAAPQTPRGDPVAPPWFGDAAEGDRPDREAAASTVVTAMSFLGVGYRHGGNSAEQGFDCSGFTRHVFEVSLGLQLPRRVDEQAQAAELRHVGRQDLRPGDLVFFNTLGRTFSHVGIYLGEGRFIHAPRSGARVRVESMDSPYWRKRYTGARRAEILAAAAD